MPQLGLFTCILLSAVPPAPEVQRFIDNLAPVVGAAESAAGFVYRRPGRSKQPQGAPAAVWMPLSGIAEGLPPSFSA